MWKINDLFNFFKRLFNLGGTMTLLEFKQKADLILIDFWKELSLKQDAYFAKHGKYFQLLISPSSKVLDGLDSSFITISPNDEKYLLDMSFSWVSKIPFQISVDEWVGETKGYSATATVIINGKTYQRTRDINKNDTGWNEATNTI